MATLRVRLLGGLDLAWDDASLPTLPGAASRSLFAYLVTHPDRPHTRDLLIGLLWPNQPEAIGRRRLSHTLWQIRRWQTRHPIDTKHQEEGLPLRSTLLTEGDTVQLEPELPLWLDVERFTLHQAACGSETADALGHCERCVEHCRGHFLSGYYYDWALEVRERLRGQFIDALQHLVDAHKARMEYDPTLSRIPAVLLQN